MYKLRKLPNIYIYMKWKQIEETNAQHSNLSGWTVKLEKKDAHWEWTFRYISAYMRKTINQTHLNR